MRPADRLYQEIAELQEEYGDVLALLDPGEAHRLAVASVLDKVGLPMSFFGEAADGLVKLVRFQGERTGALRGVVVAPGEGVGGRAIAERRVVWVQDYLDNPTITHRYDEPVRTEGLHSVVAAPVIRDETLHGVLYAAARGPSELGTRVVEGMEQVARTAASALHVAERARVAAEIAVHEERRRLSVALHDSVGALLFAIGAGAQELTAQLDALPDVARQAKDISCRAAEATTALRRSLRALNATSAELALAVAIREDCQAFKARTGVDARLLVLSDPPPLSEPATQAVVRAVREGLLNVEKHAQATSVVVTVTGRRDGVMVVVTDDGTGMGPGEGSVLDMTDSSDGMGLEAAAVRLARVGGDLRLTDNEDGGVTMRVAVPC